VWCRAPSRRRRVTPDVDALQSVPGQRELPGDQRHGADPVQRGSDQPRLAAPVRDRRRVLGQFARTTQIGACEVQRAQAVQDREELRLVADLARELEGARARPDDLVRTSFGHQQRARERGQIGAMKRLFPRRLTERPNADVGRVLARSVTRSPTERSRPLTAKTPASTPLSKVPPRANAPGMCTLELPPKHIRSLPGTPSADVTSVQLMFSDVLVSFRSAQSATHSSTFPTSR
jgi:hypothetical protein